MPRARPCPVVLAAALVVAGCGGSVLIRRDDPTFTRASARLQRTQAAVAQAGATPDQAALFMQAEGLYRYRYDLPDRSFGNYSAQVLAVATEFAPLQALAASAGMFELRLRAYDGAVQLWETLLAHHPDTPLRPLILYRLGWAYRGVQTSGLPREEPAEAFAELRLRDPGSPLVPLAAAAEAVPWKSQETAIALSIIPGAGQAYTGQWGNGVVRFAVALAAAAIILVPVAVLYDRWKDDRFFERANWAWAGTSLLGIVLLNVAYTTAYQDAQRGAVEFNERAEARFEDSHPEAP